ncbi:MAG: GMC family oxidoreductase [Geminicoccaceae bacterium]
MTGEKAVPLGRRKLSRRGLGRWGFAAGAMSLTGACAGAITQPAPVARRPACLEQTRDPDGAIDYVVIGSGAGGGVVACRLALEGFRVLILEAGGDASPLAHQAPALHLAAAGHPELATPLEAQPQSTGDRAYHYPVGRTLGGTTAIHGLCALYPDPTVWNGIANTFGDSTWDAATMHRHFQSLERCGYVDRPQDPGDPRSNPTRHGFDGWLSTSVADPSPFVADRASIAAIVRAAASELTWEHQRFRSLRSHQNAAIDPNDWRVVRVVPEGRILMPMTVGGGRRSDTRRHVQEVAGLCSDRLIVRTRCRAERILFDADNAAIGVVYNQDGSPRQVVVRREVIVAGGAFFSPQLLMLSGIGPASLLRAKGIEVRLDLPGVGKNLSDVPEISVVTSLAPGTVRREDQLTLSADADTGGDEDLARWRSDRDGLYANNGTLAAFIARSSPSLERPDLLVQCIAGDFRGYAPGFSERARIGGDVMTWRLLTIAGGLRPGEIRLNTADPSGLPNVTSWALDDGNPPALQALSNGIAAVRRASQRLGQFVEAERFPGPDLANGPQTKSFVRRHVWGSNAWGSNKMGPRSERLAVVDNQFRVHGTKRLRVVDASVLSFAPGYFIALAAMMIGEKAGDLITATARLGDVEARSV